MTQKEMKDLFKAIQIYRIIINRLGDKLKDRNKMLDAWADAKYMIQECDREYSLSKSMKKFLHHRINTAMLSTNNH